MASIDIKITKLYVFDAEGVAKATFNWSLNDAITFFNWRIVKGSKGLFISPPQQKVKEKYFGLVNITSKAIAKAVEDAALAEFKSAEKPKEKSSSSKSKKTDFDEEDLPF